MNENKYTLPSETQEAANAAYVWRLQCEAELAKAAAKQGVSFEEVNWRFQRYKLAWEKEQKFDGYVKAGGYQLLQTGGLSLAILLNEKPIAKAECEHGTWFIFDLEDKEIGSVDDYDKIISFLKAR